MKIMDENESLGLEGIEGVLRAMNQMPMQAFASV